MKSKNSLIGNTIQWSLKCPPTEDDRVRSAGGQEPVLELVEVRVERVLSKALLVKDPVAVLGPLSHKEATRPAPGGGRAVPGGQKALGNGDTVPGQSATPTLLRVGGAAKHRGVVGDNHVSNLRQ